MASQLEIEERRKHVFELMLRGTSVGAMAKVLSVHENTILNDLRQIRQQNRQKIDDVVVKEEIGEAVAKLDDLMTKALQEYELTEKDNLKAVFLEQARKALMDKMKLLVEVGVIPAATKEVTNNLIIHGVDVRSASLDELMGLRKNLIGQLGLRN